MLIRIVIIAVSKSAGRVTFGIVKAVSVVIDEKGEIFRIGLKVP
jgi:hypothetical protein